MGLKNGSNFLADFLRQCGGYAVIDGGLATELERHGADLNDPLWSAKCLVSSPHLLRRVHLDYLEAGAKIIISASYQATLQGFEAKGISKGEGEALLKRSVEIACEARNIYNDRAAKGSWDDFGDGSSLKRGPVLVAASVGSYGAYLADGSEYSGIYGDAITVKTLKDFHRRRVQVLANSGADLIAFETTPNKMEAQAYAEFLEEEAINIPAWFSFSSKDGTNVVSGDSMVDCASIADSCKQVVGIGINCTPPRYIQGLIQLIRKVTSKPILVYPNSGETYDGEKKEWVASTGVAEEDFVSYVDKWCEAGASLVGGTYNSMEYAQIVFDSFCSSSEQGYNNNTYKFNSLIKGYSLVGLFDNAILVYVRMALENVVPDEYTFPLVLSACAKNERFIEGIQVKGLGLKSGFGDDVFVLNSLIYFYSECGDVDKARKVFEKMSERNLVSWTCLISGYARREKAEEAVLLFFEMIKEGVMPNNVTMVCVILACAKLGDLGLAERVCGYIGKAGLKVNSVMVNALVDMYMKCGSLDKAKKLFEECVDRNLVLYNTILSNYVRNGMVREALDVLGGMLSCGGPRPDRVTLLSSISASTEMADVFLGKQCHAYVLRNGLENWDSIRNAIIDMYMKCGNQEWACRVFYQMSNKTVVSWNSLIAGFLRNGDVEAACRTFNEMPESDLVSWNTMIGGLVQQSMFEDAIHLFRVMQNEGIKADRVTMVSVASACGYLDMENIVMLPNLQVLKIKDSGFDGDAWRLSDEDIFNQLKFLLIDRTNLKHWEAGSVNFPKLQRLVLKRCIYLEEIPKDFGEIYTLESIELQNCRTSAAKSVKEIQEEQESMANDCLTSASTRNLGGTDHAQRKKLFLLDQEGRIIHS
ncbi:hypothetical protein K7X08_010914 [Anisodus acutangulus]|uniref:Hcy-binding domain-containing protein n=1 Tax=Anisodus acutangulus TaxID=402998 RepID=A0A9Q1M1E1_9SOLA|nr:hypothetical protein K7X08_010914 [Anisodus acutangulus]